MKLKLNEAQNIQQNFKQIQDALKKESIFYASRREQQVQMVADATEEY